MRLIGTLRDLPLPTLLQMISSSGKSGRLTLTGRGRYGVLLFDRGNIVYATTGGVREPLGSILVRGGRISEAALQEALAVQHRGKERRRLGRILVDMGALEEEALHEVLKAQMNAAVAELLRWPDGYLRFDGLRQPISRSLGLDVEVDVEDLLAEEGFAAGEVLLEAAKRLDDEGRAAGGEGDAPEHSATGLQSGDGRWQEVGGALGDLTAVVTGLRAATSTAEVGREILDYAAKIVPRGAFFSIRQRTARGLGGFGLGNGRGPEADATRQLVVPLSEPSVLSQVARRRELYRGPLPPSAFHGQLLHDLGGELPAEVVVAPLVVADRTVALLYGDNLPERRPVPPSERLEILMAQVGLALEKNVLQRKLTDLARQVSRPG